MTDPELPPPTFMTLVQTLASQAMVALGQFEDPIEKKRVKRLPMAKHFIDLLEMLQEKTKSNLNQDEGYALSQVLSQLRMAYIQSQS
jgi:Domain of unknown function (DUF1844)